MHERGRTRQPSLTAPAFPVRGADVPRPAWYRSPVHLRERLRGSIWRMVCC